jgi:large subunit ribosomal protein L24
MAKKFSNKWKSSSRKNKQRKFRDNAPSHIKHKMISAHLSKALREKYGRRSFPVRKGDTVKVMKGKFYGKTGKILIVDMGRMKIYIDGMQATKRDGSKVNVPFEPSNVMITEFTLDDKERNAALERNVKGGEVKKGEKK